MEQRKIINEHQARPSARLIGRLWGLVLLIVGLFLLLTSAVLFSSYFKGFKGNNDVTVAERSGRGREVEMTVIKSGGQINAAEDHEAAIKRGKIFVFCCGTTIAVAALQVIGSLAIICRDPVKNKPNTGRAVLYPVGLVLVASALICVIYNGYIAVGNVSELDVEKKMWVFASVAEVIVCNLGWMIARVFDKEYIGIDITPSPIDCNEFTGLQELTPEQMRELYR